MGPFLNFLKITESDIIASYTYKINHTDLKKRYHLQNY